jgi:4-hydroxy-2-oxoheptanedioate aldolase
LKTKFETAKTLVPKAMAAGTLNREIGLVSVGSCDGAVREALQDYITYDVEHSALDAHSLLQFMRGLVDGGPTRSGHRTPAVIVRCPSTDRRAPRSVQCMDDQAGARRHARPVACHVESPEAVRAFVQASRYSFTPAVGSELGAGRRGHGGQTRAAEIWGIPVDEYFARADPWPLNPRGELLLGIKVENTRALANVERTTKVPGLAFAEWGPGDMGMSMGYPDQHDEPWPAPMQAARTRIMTACKARAGVPRAGHAAERMQPDWTAWRSLRL